MQNLATRISNVIYWISISLTALCLGGVTYAAAEHFGYRNEFEASTLVLAVVGVIPLTAIWVIVQYLVSGKVELLNKKIVAGLILAAVAIGGVTGFNSGDNMKKKDIAFEQKTAAEKSARQEYELNSLVKALDACKAKHDTFEAARKDKDYQMAQDLYQIYVSCMFQNDWALDPWSRELFETGKQKQFPAYLKRQ